MTPSPSTFGDAPASPVGQSKASTFGDAPANSSRTFLDDIGDYAKGAWSNLNPVKAVMGAAQAVNHPIDTIIGIGQSNQDLADKAEAAFKKGNLVEGGRHVIDYLLNALPGFGSAADQAGNDVQNGQVAKGLGEATGLALPYAAGPVFSKIGDVVGSAADSTANSLTRGALRGGFSNTKPAAVVDEAAQAMRAANIPLSREGANAVTGSLADLQRQKMGLLGRGAQQGMTVNPDVVRIALDDLATKWKGQINPKQDLSDIRTVRDNFLDEHGGKGPIPIDRAEEIKEGTYTQNKYGDQPPPHLVATAAAEKAAAHAIMTEIAKQLPEVGEINAQQGGLQTLQPILQQAVNKYINDGRFLGTLKDSVASPASKLLNIAGSGAAVASHDPVFAGAGVAASAMQAILSDPVVKSQLARVINKAQQLNPSRYGVPNVAGSLARVDGYLTLLSKTQPAQQQPQQ